MTERGQICKSSHFGTPAGTKHHLSVKKCDGEEILRGFKSIERIELNHKIFKLTLRPLLPRSNIKIDEQVKT